VTAGYKNSQHSQPHKPCL